jgi:hypothetical protein
MSEITKQTLTKALKPFDIVSDEKGNVGIVQEVGVNPCQDGFDSQISYAVEWITGTGSKHAWYDHGELKFHCNIFVKIAEMACHPMGNNAYFVKHLFNNTELSD